MLCKASWVLFLYKKRTEFRYALKGGESVKEFFEQYGGVVITATAIIAIVAIIGLLAAANANGVIYGAFKNLIDSFVSKTTL